MAEQRRVDRLAQQLRAELGILIETELDDPRVEMAVVTHVRVSRDMSHARVSISTIGSEADRKTTLDGLHSARGFLRKQLSQRLGHLKRIPELTFEYDESVEKEMRIQELLAEIHSDEQ
jgi:ribosome-binding factor A